MERHEMKDHSGLAGKSRSFWVASTPETGYPALEGDLTVDVAVVGGGIVGVTTAVLLRQDGYSVALLEADRLARGVTGHTTAKVTSLHGLIYAYLVEQFGREKALQYAEANQKGVESVAGLISEHRIACDFVRLSFYSFAQSDDGLRQVEAEVKAALDLDLPATYVDSIPLDVPCRGAIRFDAQAQFHPRKYLLGLAETIPSNRCFIFENTRVKTIDGGRPCLVEAEGGSVRADKVVIATHYPISAARAFYFARLHQERHYALALSTDGSFPHGMFIAAEDDGYSYRASPWDDGELVIVSGGPHHTTGQDDDTRAYYRELGRHVTQVYPDGQIRYHWATQDAVTLDRVPYIGWLTPTTENLYTATGFAAWGMSAGTAAALILRDLIQSGSSPWAPVFDPQRLTPDASAGQFLSQNVDVAQAFIGGWVRIPEEQIESVAAGEGRVLEAENEKVAVFKDSEEKLYTVNPVCRHLGCLVTFNSAEKSWDCPCHGSRYAPDGSVLHTPTTEPLPRVDLDPGDRQSNRANDVG